MKGVEMFQGNATINQLLFQYCRQHTIAYEIIHHRATRSAEETQYALENSASPLRTSVIVQKTVTAATSHGLTLLITGMGNFRIDAEDKRKLRAVIGKCDITLNPLHLNPLELFGKQDGEVTPFLPTDVYEGIHHVYLCDLDTAYTHVAVSLSLYESLCLPKRDFLAMRAWYLLHYTGRCQIIASSENSLVNP